MGLHVAETKSPLGRDRLAIAASDQQLGMSAGVCKDENFPEKQGIPECLVLVTDLHLF